MNQTESSGRPVTLQKTAIMIIAAFIWMQIILVGGVALLRIQRGGSLDFDFSRAIPAVNSMMVTKILAIVAIGAALGAQFLRSRLSEDAASGVRFQLWIVGLALSEAVGLCGFMIAFVSELNFEVVVIFAAISIASTVSYGSLARSLRA